MVFLPNSPRPQSGISMVFDASDVEVTDLPALRVFEIPRFNGKGMGRLAARDELPAPSAETT